MRFCWVGLATSDPPAARTFYARLFGWEAEPAADGSFTILTRAGKAVAILYPQTAQARAAAVAPHWTAYAPADDADAVAARALELGATQPRPPFDVLDYGRVATLRDPVGAIVSLWQPGSRAGAELTGVPGALCRAELAAPDPTRAARFYRELFGWSEGIREQREDEYGSAPNWTPYFGVESVERAARAAEAAGGRRLGPGRVADPQGASFGLVEAR